MGRGEKSVWWLVYCVWLGEEERREEHHAKAWEAYDTDEIDGADERTKKY